MKVNQKSRCKIKYKPGHKRDQNGKQTKEKIVGNKVERHMCVSGGKECSFFRKIWRVLFP